MKRFLIFSLFLTNVLAGHASQTPERVTVTLSSDLQTETEKRLKALLWAMQHAGKGGKPESCLCKLIVKTVEKARSFEDFKHRLRAALKHEKGHKHHHGK